MLSHLSAIRHTVSLSMKASSHAWMLSGVNTYFSGRFQKFQNRYISCPFSNGKCTKMRTNNPMFGPVVLEIACDIFVNKISLHCSHVVSMKVKCHNLIATLYHSRLYSMEETGYL